MDHWDLLNLRWSRSSIESVRGKGTLPFAPDSPLVQLRVNEKVDRLQITRSRLGVGDPNHLSTLSPVSGLGTEVPRRSDHYVSGILPVTAWEESQSLPDRVFTGLSFTVNLHKTLNHSSVQIYPYYEGQIWWTEEWLSVRLRDSFQPPTSSHNSSSPLIFNP